MKMTVLGRIAPVAALVALVGCGTASPPESKPAAAKVDNPKPEAALTTVTLTAESEQHLALTIADVAAGAVERSLALGGDVIEPPGRRATITAPVAGTLTAPASGPIGIGPVTRGQALFGLVPLQQGDRDLRAATERDRAEARARLTLAEQNLQRLEGLLKDGSVSARAVEEARAGRDLARAALEAAEKQEAALGQLPVGDRGEMALAAPFDGVITQLVATAGQVVAAGAAVADISHVSTLWVRVPVFAGDLASLDASGSASVARLGQESSGPWLRARRVSGPPTARSGGSSVDVFYEVPNADRSLRLGERLVVRLPLKAGAGEEAILVPSSAVVYDIHGGTWVYEATAPHVFVRRRVELAGPSGSSMIVRRGLAAGTRIVTAGAAELYGTEFFVNK